MHILQNKRDPGFSLIEMAFIMMIVGVVVATIMPRIVGTIGKDKARKAKFNLQEVRDEILGYAAVKGTLPEPDTSTGTSLVPSALISHSKDAWDQPIGYLVARADTGANLTVTNVNSSSLSGTQLSVILNPYEGSAASLSQTTENVAFVIYSTGPNRTMESIDSVVDGIGTFTYYPYDADLDTANPGEKRNDDQIEFAIFSYVKEKAKASAEQASDTSPPGTPVGSIDFTSGSGDISTQNGATSTDAATAGGGIGEVLDLRGNRDFAEVTNSSDYNLHQYTIMGWYKPVANGPQNNNDFQPIINRQGEDAFTDRNYWIVLWSSVDQSGFTPEPHNDGQLVMRASDAANAGSEPYWDFDSNEADGPGNSPDHDNSYWHFFAVTMDCVDGQGCDDPHSVAQSQLEHTATIYVSHNNTCSWATDIAPNVDTLTNHQDTGQPMRGPELSEDYEMYIGAEVDMFNTRNFDGFIDEITIYDHALTADELQEYYERVANNFMVCP